MDILQSLCELIEDPPNLILRNLSPLRLAPRNQITQAPSLTVLHRDIHRNILLVDLVIQIPQDMDILHPDQGIDFIDDMFFLLGGDRRKGDLFEHDLFLGGLAASQEEGLGAGLEQFVALLHFVNDCLCLNFNNYNSLTFNKQS